MQTVASGKTSPLPFRSWRWERYWLPVVIVVPVFLIYALGLGYPLVFDDLNAQVFDPRKLQQIYSDHYVGVVRWPSSLSFVWTIKVFGAAERMGHDTGDQRAHHGALPAAPVTVDCRAAGFVGLPDRAWMWLSSCSNWLDGEVSPLPIDCSSCELIWILVSVNAFAPYCWFSAVSNCSLTIRLMSDISTPVPIDWP